MASHIARDRPFKLRRKTDEEIIRLTFVYANFLPKYGITVKKTSDLKLILRY